MGASQQVLASLGSSFTPTDIPLLKLWLKADAGTNQTAGGAAAVADVDPVGEWLDQSGNGNHFVQATSTQRGTLKLGIQNSKSVVRLDGVDDRLALASFAIFPSKRGTVFVVMRATAVAARSNVFATTGLTQCEFYLAFFSTIKPTAWWDSVTEDRIEADATEYTTWNIHSICRDSNTNLAYRRNGVDRTGRTIADNQPSVSSLTLGADPSGVKPMNGDFAEVLIYDAALSAGEIASVETYLNARWAAF